MAGERDFSQKKKTDQLWGPPSFLFNAYRGSFLGVQRLGREVDHSPQLMPRLRMSGAIHLLTPWSRVLFDYLTGFQPVKKFSAFYGTRKFITAFTSACHLSLSWASSIQSKPPHPTSWRSILILSSHLRLGLPSGLFPSGFPHQHLVYASPLPHTCHMPRPSHSSRFDPSKNTYVPYMPSWLGQEQLCLFIYTLKK